MLNEMESRSILNTKIESSDTYFLDLSGLVFLEIVSGSER